MAKLSDYKPKDLLDHRTDRDPRQSRWRRDDVTEEDVAVPVGQDGDCGGGKP